MKVSAPLRLVTSIPLAPLCMNPIPPHLQVFRKGRSWPIRKGESNDNLSTFTGEPGNKETSISLHSCGRRVTSSSWIEDKDLGKPHQFHSMSGPSFLPEGFLKGNDERGLVFELTKPLSCLSFVTNFNFLGFRLVNSSYALFKKSSSSTQK
jgi:hypothetical protein